MTAALARSGRNATGSSCFTIGTTGTSTWSVVGCFAHWLARPAVKAFICFRSVVRLTDCDCTGAPGRFAEWAPGCCAWWCTWPTVPVSRALGLFCLAMFCFVVRVGHRACTPRAGSNDGLRASTQGRKPKKQPQLRSATGDGGQNTPFTCSTTPRTQLLTQLTP